MLNNMKKLSRGTQNFWTQIIIYIIFSTFTIVVAFQLYGWQLAGTSAFLLFIYFLWLLFDIKRKLIRSLTNKFEYKTVDIKDYSLLDFNWFQEQTDELKLLGFVQIRDYTTGKTQGFARCFAHPENHCYAEINESFRANGASFSRNTVIMSELTQDWSLSSINHEANTTASIAYGFWRNPKSVRIYQDELSLDELLNRHLQMRQQMINDIGVSLLTDVSWDNYVEKQQEAAIYRNQSLKRKFLLLAMINVTKFELNPKSEWLGDYAKFIRTKAL
jgi:Ca2+/Na+ antiporter